MCLLGAKAVKKKSTRTYLKWNQCHLTNHHVMP
uniref:Uncharacterized protein n=1 Tax=Rhizophora mucronata TaxID=61149 RepID=A0A2P2L7K7_RHIMU